MLAGEVKAFFGLGGNFVRAIPERETMEKAWRDLALTVQIATKLNRSHLVNGKVAYLLPMPRTDRGRHPGQRSAGGDDGGHFQLHHWARSAGASRRASISNPRSRSWPSSPRRRCMPNPKVQWDEWTGDYALIRDLIAETYPEEFHDFNAQHVDAGRLLPRQPGARTDLEDRQRQSRIHDPATLCPPRASTRRPAATA